MMKSIVLAFCVGLVITAQAEEKKTIYKYTDENGVIHYTESPPDERYKEAKLKPLSVLPSRPASQDTISSNAGTSSPVKDKSHTKVVSMFKIIKPVPEENLWGTGGTVTAEVSPLSEAQSKVYEVQFVLDGEKQKPSAKTTQVFSEVFRGEHSIQALLLRKDNGREVNRTQKVTFFVHQSSKK